MDELVIENHKLHQEFKCSETERKTTQTAKKIRSDIKQMQPLYEFSNLMQFSESHNANSLPVSLQILLTNIIACSNDRMTSQQHQRMNSIAADLVYTITSGRIKMPKHVLLPFSIKSLTGNVEVIHILNRLGHGIAGDRDSYCHATATKLNDCTNQCNTSCFHYACMGQH